MMKKEKEFYRMPIVKSVVLQANRTLLDASPRGVDSDVQQFPDEWE